MIEKVNPCHPDKIADRIAGAVVDLAYKAEENPKIAVEVLIGHGVCHIVAETSAAIDKCEVCRVVHRITGSHSIMVNFMCVKQDEHLAKNQSDKIRCGDNGIFKGVPLTAEQKKLSEIARQIYYFYERDGKYQLYVKEVKMDGQGDLYRRFELLKAELLEMGMFDASYKKPLPKYAMKVGIVTAKTGAAIQDIINVSTRRNPHIQLYLYPALVQGAEAAPTIVRGIQTLDALGLDVLIVGRGGGSLEDLWAFNEEIVARAIFNCNTPVISAVGHETDTTIADYVADMRAPTPSAAAELAVFDYNVYIAELNGYLEMFNKSMRNKHRATRDLLNQYALRVKHMSPSNRITTKRQEIDDICSRMSEKIKLKLERKRYELSLGIQRLEGASPLNKLKSGYSYVSDENGNTLKSVEQVNSGDNVEIFLLDGRINANIIDKVKKDDFFI